MRIELTSHLESYFGLSNVGRHRRCPCTETG